MLTIFHILKISRSIKQLDLDFSNGFSVMTGETGAGKSIIIDALSLLCGARSGRDVIRSGERMATVQAVFEHCPKQVLQLIADADCGQIDDDTVMFEPYWTSWRGRTASNVMAAILVLHCCVTLQRVFCKYMGRMTIFCFWRRKTIWPFWMTTHN